jgi:hypothetical protein
MKNLKTIMIAAAFAASFAPSLASAADVSHPSTAITMDGLFTGDFGSGFGTKHAGDTFLDKFTFDVTGSPLEFSASLTSTANKATEGLNISSFNLFTSTGTLIGTGTGTVGKVDRFSVSNDVLGVGSYYLQVGGNVLSTNGAHFDGNIALSPVPEPETYAMMLAGLGLVGFAARRRKAAKQA